MKDILNEYTTWKTFPAREAMEKYTGVQSRLSSISSLCAEANVSEQCEPCPKLSFEMNILSESMSFGQLGRIVLEGKDKTDTAGSCSQTDTHEPGDLPPNRKRKKSLSSVFM